MDLDLKELGTTFMIGAFAILGLEAILFCFFGIRLTGFFPDKWRPREILEASANSNNSTGSYHDDGKPSMKAVLFIGLAFALGILAEDLSYKYVDSVEIPFKWLPASISSLLPSGFSSKLGLPSKEDARVNTLIKDLTENPKPEPLALTLAQEHAWSGIGITDGETIEEWLTQSPPCVPDGPLCYSSARIIAPIKTLYYYAKNRAYAEATYYDEMKRIQSRVDFSRSITVFAFIYFLFSGCLTLVSILLTSRRFKLKIWRTHQKGRIHKGLAVSAILFVIYFFTIWGYARESDEFNKRAFGYYSAMLIKAKQVERSNRDNTAIPDYRFQPIDR